MEERVSQHKGAYNHLATKAELLATKADILAAKADLVEVKASLADLKAELTWRVAGLQLAGLAAVAAIMGFLR